MEPLLSMGGEPNTKCGLLTESYRFPSGPNYFLLFFFFVFFGVCFNASDLLYQLLLTNLTKHLLSRPKRSAGGIELLTAALRRQKEQALRYPRSTGGNTRRA